MHPALRRALVLAALAAPICGAAHAQTVCDRLLPLGLVLPEGGFETGCASRVVLRRGPGTGVSGYYVGLAYPSCASGPCAGMTGALQFVCEMTSGYACCLSVPQPVPLVAGNYTGPLRLGLDQRIASDTDTRAGICFSDYTGNGSRLADVPVIRPIAIGVSQAEIAGFLRLFITAPAPGNGDVTVEFVSGPTPLQRATWGRTKITYR